MNEIQKKIDFELRRPNAGKDALCNVVADVAQSIADNAGGGGTSIPEINVISTEEITIDEDVVTVYNFQEGTDEIIEKLVADNSGDSINAGSITMTTCYISYSAVDSDGTRISCKCILLDQVSTDDEVDAVHYQLIYNPLLRSDVLFRYVDYPEVGDLNNRWFLKSWG